jgi:preprotein translocase subunit SecG
MTTVLLMIHLFVTLAMIGVVLIQRSEGGGLGIGTSQGMGSFMTGRGTANLLTRSTAILATIFMVLSLTLALLNRGTGGVGRSILDVPATSAPALPTPSANPPATSAPTASSPAPPAAGAPATAPPPAGSTPPAAPKPPQPGPSVPTN